MSFVKNVGGWLGQRNAPMESRENGREKMLGEAHMNGYERDDYTDYD